MRRKKQKGHLVEIVVILLIFAVLAVANALSSADFRSAVKSEIAIAEARFEAERIGNPGD